MHSFIVSSATILTILLIPAHGTRLHAAMNDENLHRIPFPLSSSTSRGLQSSSPWVTHGNDDVKADEGGSLCVEHSFALFEESGPPEDLVRSKDYCSWTNGTRVCDYVPAFSDDWFESCRELGGRIAIIKLVIKGSECYAVNPNVTETVELLPMCVSKTSCVNPKQFADEYSEYDYFPPMKECTAEASIEGCGKTGRHRCPQKFQCPAMTETPVVWKLHVLVPEALGDEFVGEAETFAADFIKNCGVNRLDLVSLDSYGMGPRDEDKDKDKDGDVMGDGYEDREYLMYIHFQDEFVRYTIYDALYSEPFGDFLFNNATDFHDEDGEAIALYVSN